MGSDQTKKQLKQLATKQKLAKYLAIWVGSISVIVLISYDIKKNAFDPKLSDFCEKNNKTCNQYIRYNDHDHSILYRNSSMSTSLEHTYFDSLAFTSAIAGLICTVLAWTVEAASMITYRSANATDEETPLLSKAPETLDTFKSKALSTIHAFKKPLWETLELTTIIFITIIVLSAMQVKMIKDDICSQVSSPERARHDQVSLTCHQFPSSTSSDEINRLKKFRNEISERILQASAIQGAEYAASFAAIVFVIFCAKKCLGPSSTPKPLRNTTINQSFGYGTL